MESTKKFHYIVRGVIVKDNKILIAQHHDKETTFLPGGHIEDYEGAENAIIREIKEELKYKCNIDFFLGAIENKWKNANVKNYELNLIFKISIKDIQTDTIPKSYDSSIHFFWIDLHKIDFISLKPAGLNELILTNINKINNQFWKTN